MADLTIGQLTKSDEMTDDALLPLEQGGEARVITGALIKRYALDSVQPYADAAESAAGRAENAVGRAENAAGSAEASAESAQADASDAGVSAASAKEDAAKAAASEAVVQASANAAAASEANAAASAAAAAASQSAAAVSEANAKASESAAAASAGAAKTSETNAAASETAAAASARAAKDSESNAASSATAAAASRTAAKTSETNAAASAKRAEDAAAQAGEIVGGDFATKIELNAHAGDTTKHVTADERNAWNAKCGKAVAFTVTLSAVGWSENTQTVSDARFLADGYAYSVAPDSGSFSVYGEAMIYADNVTTAGQMRFHCSEAPATDLTVNILRMEASA